MSKPTTNSAKPIITKTNPASTETNSGRVVARPESEKCDDDDDGGQIPACAKQRLAHGFDHIQK